jgi:phage/plasmid primase-like uncharacterized protein
MANMKKPAPKKPTVSRAPSKSVKTPMPKKEGAKSGTKKLMSSTTKKVKVEGPSNYTPNSKKYQLPMTPAQMQRYNKLASSPKTSDTLFTIPKGAAKLPQKEIDAMQRRRVADRKRTLARAESIIRRTKIK